MQCGSLCFCRMASSLSLHSDPDFAELARFPRRRKPERRPFQGARSAREFQQVGTGQQIPHSERESRQRHFALFLERQQGSDGEGFSPNEWTPHNKLTEQQQLLNIHKGRKEIFWLKQKTWEKHVFFEESGGYVAIHKQRIAASKVSNAERAKFEKELRMCENYARAGFRIKMLEEKSGISSPDVLCNDTPAELKSVTSKQIENKAKKAFRKQGAKLVLFEIEEEDNKAHSNLYKLQHRYYYSVMYYFKSTPEKVIAQLVEE